MTHTPLNLARGTSATLAAYVVGAGEVLFNTDDYTLHVGDGVTLGGIKGGGSAWVNVGGGGGAPAFANSWVNAGGSLQVARFRRNLVGDVILEGAVKTGSTSAAIFTLPAGFRPPLDVEFVCWCSTGAYKLLVTAAGVVTPTSASATETSISGARFGTT